jgi:F-type H+-transporting ATPase subunit c
LEEGHKTYREKEIYMSEKRLIGILTTVLLLGTASVALAGDASAQATGLWIYFGIAISCGLGIGVAALGTGLAMGNAINAALQGTARNPEAGGKIMTTMIIGLALIESLCIYALLVCLLMVFKIPDFDILIKNVFH